MHARMTSVHVAPDQADAAITAYLETVPAGAKEMGAQGTVLLINRETGEGLSFTLWADEATMLASEERASELRQVVSGQMGAMDAPRVERYEVVHLEMP